MKSRTETKLKFKALQRRLGLQLWQAVGLLETLWIATYSNALAGDIGRLSNQEIAVALEWDGDADDLIAALVEMRWLDEDLVYRLIVHDWSEHCAHYLRGAFAKNGKKFADQEARERGANRNTIPNQTNKQGAKQAAKQPARQKYSEEFEEWYEAYPVKAGKDAAAKAYSRAVTRIGQPDAAQWLLEITRKYAATDKAKGGFCPYPATFLNQGRYQDDPATWRDQRPIVANSSVTGSERDAAPVQSFADVAARLHNPALATRS